LQNRCHGAESDTKSHNYVTELASKHLTTQFSAQQRRKIQARDPNVITENNRKKLVTLITT